MIKRRVIEGLFVFELNLFIISKLVQMPHESVFPLSSIAINHFYSFN